MVTGPRQSDHGLPLPWAPGNWSYWGKWSGSGGHLDSEGAVEEVDREQSRIDFEEVRDPLHNGDTIVY